MIAAHLHCCADKVAKVALISPRVFQSLTPCPLTQRDGKTVYLEEPRLTHVVVASDSLLQATAAGFCFPKSSCAAADAPKRCEVAAESGRTQGMRACDDGLNRWKLPMADITATRLTKVSNCRADAVRAKCGWTHTATVPRFSEAYSYRSVEGFFCMLRRTWYSCSRHGSTLFHPGSARQQGTVCRNSLLVVPSFCLALSASTSGQAGLYRRWLPATSMRGQSCSQGGVASTCLSLAGITSNNVKCRFTFATVRDQAREFSWTTPDGMIDVQHKYLPTVALL